MSRPQFNIGDLYQTCHVRLLWNARVGATDYQGTLRDGSFVIVLEPAPIGSFLHVLTEIGLGFIHVEYLKKA